MEATQKTKEFNSKNLKTGLDLLLKSTDPMYKWEPVLNEVKSYLIEAKNKEVPPKKIHQVFKDNGAEIPFDVLRTYMKTLA